MARKPEPSPSLGIDDLTCPACGCYFEDRCDGCDCHYDEDDDAEEQGDEDDLA